MGKHRAFIETQHITVQEKSDNMTWYETYSLLLIVSMDRQVVSMTSPGQVSCLSLCSWIKLFWLTGACCQANSDKARDRIRRPTSTFKGWKISFYSVQPCHFIFNICRMKIGERSQSFWFQIHVIRFSGNGLPVKTLLVSFLICSNVKMTTECTRCKSEKTYCIDG